MRAIDSVPPVEVVVMPRPSRVTSWRNLLDLCWKSKLALALMVVGFLLQLLILWG